MSLLTVGRRQGPAGLESSGMATFTLDTGASIPKSVVDGVERFCREVQEALGEDLQSLVLFGGIPRDEYYPHSSDVNLMLVCRTVTTQVLDRVGPAHRKALLSFRLSPMVLSPEDLRRSTDVFPTKFMLMQRYHTVLHGTDPFSELEISREHLRLRCEQELKNLLLRLRGVYLQAQRPEKVEAVLASMISSLLGSLSTLLFLKAQDFPKRNHEVVQAAAAEFGLDEPTLRDCLGLKSRRNQPTPEQLKSLYDRFMAQVEKAAEIADRME